MKPGWETTEKAGEGIGPVPSVHSVIVSDRNRGDGRETPVRRVVTFHSLDGMFLGERDTADPGEMLEMYDAVGQALADLERIKKDLLPFTQYDQRSKRHVLIDWIHQGIRRESRARSEIDTVMASLRHAARLLDLRRR